LVLSLRIASRVIAGRRDGAALAPTQQAAGRADGPVVLASVLDPLLPFALLAGLSPGGSASPLPLVEPVRAIAASEAGLVAVTTRDIRILDPLGHPVRRLSLDPAAPPPAAHASVEAAPEDSSPLTGLGGDADWSDTYDPDDPDLADSEIVVSDQNHHRTGRKKGNASSATRAGGEVVAATPGAVWLGRANGLWRLDLPEGAATRVLPARGEGVRAVAAAPDGRVIAAAIDEDGLLRSEDGGQTFESLTAVTGALRGLAVDGAGAIFVLDGDGLREIGPDQKQPGPAEIDRPVDVARCGNETIVLTQGAVIALGAGARAASDAPAEELPPGVRHLACTPDGALWIVFGAHLWTSADRGQSWVPRTDLPPSPVAGVATTRDLLWVATTSGLWPLPLVEAEPDTPPPPSIVKQPLALDLDQPPPICRWWYNALPRVDFDFIVGRSATRRDVRATILVTFVLDRGRLSEARGARLRQELAQRRQMIAATPVGSAAFPTLATDPVGVEERATLIRTLEDDP
jgi:hypothetical protein